MQLQLLIPAAYIYIKVIYNDDDMSRHKENEDKEVRKKW